MDEGAELRKRRPMWTKKGEEKLEWSIAFVLCSDSVHELPWYYYYTAPAATTPVPVVLWRTYLAQHRPSSVPSVLLLAVLLSPRRQEEYLRRQRVARVLGTAAVWWRGVCCCATGRLIFFSAARAVSVPENGCWCWKYKHVAAEGYKHCCCIQLSDACEGVRYRLLFFSFFLLRLLLYQILRYTYFEVLRILYNLYSVLRIYVFV